ncbi:hypothetical protein FB45DRAFT_339795 [Roridomyces roridus]|uniref:RING-type domain-containing protein n=1 Tax=Roridomyces roridus TaxID=1738132 RepID=A0AAD7B3P1_9AGAR|nr:hypothetical protein FB45DRAFT_339795 [Roridomyces roridus]
MHRRSSSSLCLLAAIPEEPPSLLFDTKGDDDPEYFFDLGSGATQSGYQTPIPVGPRETWNPRRSEGTKRTTSTSRTRTRTTRGKTAERECGICFELAVSPVRTLCCAHIFCVEHILSWLEGPAADGHCPSCGSPSAATGMDLLALGHPAFLRPVPRTPPLSRSCSPCFPDKHAVYASYPSVPIPSLPSPSLSCDSSSSSDQVLSEDEEHTDFSLPALVRARALQTRRHVAHPLGSLLGLRGMLICVSRAALLVLVLGMLAGNGRWREDTGVEIDGVQGEGWGR